MEEKNQAIFPRGIVAERRSRYWTHCEREISGPSFAKAIDGCLYEPDEISTRNEEIQI